MSLVVKIAISFSATQVIVDDVTGAYNVTTNPGGYGAPNNAFSDYAHYLVLRKKNVNNVADVVMSLNSYTPSSATEWAATRTIDGWYEAKKLNIPVWTAGTYASGTVKYYGGQVYQSNTSTSSTPGADGTWVVVSDLTTIEDNATIITTILGRSTVYNANVYRAKQIALSSQQGRCAIADDDRLKSRYEKIDYHLQAALNADQLGLNSDAEFNVQALILLGAA